MDKRLIDQVVAELKLTLAETVFRSITQIGKYSLVITLEGDTFRRLLVSIEPRDPRLYLIRRRDRELKKLTTHRSLFAIAADTYLAGLPFESIHSTDDERIVEMVFGNSEQRTLLIQLTGSSSNLFLLHSSRLIEAAARTSNAVGQTVGSEYAFSASGPTSASSSSNVILPNEAGSISETLDSYYSKIDDETAFKKVAESARTKNRQQITKASRLIRNLENDLLEHGDAEKWKRLGDLLLASQGNAVREVGIIKVVDMFDEAQPTIKIEADDNDSLPETAQKYFRRYAKARNARVEVEQRIDKTNKEILRLEKAGIEIEAAVECRDVESLTAFTGPAKTSRDRPSNKIDTKAFQGIRSYISSDGFDILVGKKATDNDYLTLRVAHSRDTWMHAADYPGSHVVIRNANRKDIPQRTIIEAAQLAAFFSQGNKQTKAAVNYTEKKFVSKPKGSAPGLVRLASFKTLLVEPIFPNVSKKG